MDISVRENMTPMKNLRFLALECRLNIKTVTFLFIHLPNLTNFDALCVDSKPGDHCLWERRVFRPNLQQLGLAAGKSHLTVTQLRLVGETHPFTYLEVTNLHE